LRAVVLAVMEKSFVASASLLRLCALSLAVLGATAGSALASGSSAFGLSANFTVGGVNTALEPVKSAEQRTSLGL